MSDIGDDDADFLKHLDELLNYNVSEDGTDFDDGEGSILDLLWLEEQDVFDFIPCAIDTNE